MPAPSVPVVHFDTSRHAPKERFDAWHQNMSVFFDLSSPEGGLPKKDIAGAISACNLGETVFGVTRSETQLFERKSLKIARDDMDHILVQVFLEGGGITDGEEQISAGDMLIIDMDQPHAMRTTEFANLTLVLPRVLRTPLSELLSPLHGKRLSKDNPMIRFMGDHLKAMWESVPDMNRVEAKVVLDGTLGLMEGWLSQEGRLSEDSPPEVSAALGKSIQLYIEQHLSEPMTPQKLAAKFRISRSQIYRIFAPYDGVARYVWERRMLRSRRMLSEFSLNHLTIGTIGYECGFLSESHFSRTFKSRFGVSPREMRMEASGAMTTQQDPNEFPVFPSWVVGLPKTGLIADQR